MDAQAHHSRATSSPTPNTKHWRAGNLQSPKGKAKIASPLRVRRKAKAKDCPANTFPDENKHSQNGSSKIRGDGIRRKKSPRNREEEVAVSVIDNGGKEPNRKK